MRVHGSNGEEPAELDQHVFRRRQSHEQRVATGGERLGKRYDRL